MERRVPIQLEQNTSIIAQHLNPMILCIFVKENSMSLLAIWCQMIGNKDDKITIAVGYDLSYRTC